MKVLFTDQAFQALEEVKTFLIEQQKLTETKATAIILDLVDKAEELKDFPDRGQIEEYLEYLQLNHRRIVVKHTKIIYRVVAKTVYITDFFDTRQSPKSLAKRVKRKKK